MSGDGPLYRRLGFTPAPAGDRLGSPRAARGRIGRRTRRRLASRRDQRATVDLRLAVEDDIPLLARIYDAEPVRFVRDAADWRALLRASVVFAWPARCGSSPAPAPPAGYLAVTRSARRRVLELAGDRDAVLAAAPRVADEVVVPAHDTETARDLPALAWENRAFTLPAGHQWLQPPPRPLPIPWYGLNYV